MLGLRSLTIGLTVVAGVAMAQETIDREMTRELITPILMSLPLQNVGQMDETTAFAVAGCVVNGATPEEIVVLYENGAEGGVASFLLIAEIMQREEVNTCLVTALG